MRAVAPAPQKRPMTTELFQAYWLPPYSRASSNWMAAGAKIAKPMRSSFLWSALKNEKALGLAVCLGTVTRQSVTATRPPIGKLM